jgi:hypothetical protein
MKLRDILFEATPNTPKVISMLQKNLPEIKIRQDLFGGIRIGKGFGGLDLLDVLGFDEKAINRKVEQVINQHNIDEYDEEGQEMAWFDALDEIAEKAIKRFSAFIPDGWRLEGYLFSMERDPYDPYFTINVSRDIDRKSRSKEMVWYHITPVSLLPSILQDGLTPKSSSRGFMFGTFRNKIFLFSKRSLNSNLNKVKEVAKNLQSKASPDVFGASFQQPDQLEDVALLEITLSNEYTKRLDRAATEIGGVYIQREIPPELIRVVYKGPIDNLAGKRT